MMKLALFVYLFVLIPWSASSLSPDGLSLLALKSAVDLASPSPIGRSLPFSDWNPGDPNPCRWSGVTCANVSGVERVVAVAISGRGLQGYIPSELGELVFLRRLNLHRNRLSGAIPAQLFNATSLHSLFLYGNNLSGEIPAAVCSVPRLQNLDLSHNSLSGELPRSFGECRQLQRLLLAGNRLSGRLPAGIWAKLGNLVELDLSDNELVGSIPPDLGRLAAITGTLNLSYNQFSGKIPKSLGNLAVTVNFDLRNNNLTGEIPQSGSFAYQGPNAFLGNAGLCGFPLRKPCHTATAAAGPGAANPPPRNPNRSSDDEGGRKKGLKPGRILLISAADAAGVAAAGLVVVYIYWRRKDSRGCSCRRRRKLGGGDKSCLCFCWRAIAGGKTGNSSGADSERWGVEADESLSDGGGGEGKLVAIDKGFKVEVEELLRASAYVLGRSGKGIVYKVVVGGGVAVAVRRLGEGGGGRGYYREFAEEAAAIGRVRHQNVVRMRAYYWAPDEKLLISDYIPNGNLSTALHGKPGKPGPTITWSTRLKIGRGIARGLAYLHECNPRKYVHGDVKPANVLLDADHNPYLADFGLHRLLSVAGVADTSSSSSSSYLPSTRLSSDRSLAYRAPEARLPGARPTQKWDVYSFGLILIEMLTGRSPEVAPAAGEVVTMEVVRWVRKGFEEESPLSEMVDAGLLHELQAKKEVVAAFHIALACTETDPELRPRMKTVSEHLERMGSR